MRQEAEYADAVVKDLKEQVDEAEQALIDAQDDEFRDKEPLEARALEAVYDAVKAAGMGIAHVVKYDATKGYSLNGQLVVGLDGMAISPRAAVSPRPGSGTKRTRDEQAASEGGSEEDEAMDEGV